MTDDLNEDLLDAQDVTGEPSPGGSPPDDLSDEGDAVVYNDGEDISDAAEPARPASGVVPDPVPDHGEG